MLKKIVFYIVRTVLLACSLSMSANALTEYMPDYTCPESYEVKVAILSAINENKIEVIIPARFGSLQASITTIDTDDLSNLSFSYAIFLFGDPELATFEVACAYKTPSIVLYKYKNTASYTLYIGASPNWIPDENQLYATCTYSAKYCVFMKKPSTSV